MWVCDYSPETKQQKSLPCCDQKSTRNLHQNQSDADCFLRLRGHCSLEFASQGRTINQHFCVETSS